MAAVPNRPMSRAPTTPPKKWTPMTSRESSRPIRYLRLTARAQTAPATSPITVAPRRFTKPQAGVMATRPATAPEAAPRVVDLPPFSFSTAIQDSSAAAVAVLVFTKAWADSSLAARADPALKPNHPNHRIPAPRTVKGTLCGGIGSLGQPRLRPRAAARAAPPMAALMWTTVPPAKSSAPLLASHPVGEKTQWATGAYTAIAHRVMNTTKLPNLSRSAEDPVIRAGVMTANIIWKMTNTRGG